jgi:hypothetical protein
VEDIRERAANVLEAQSLEDRQYRLEELKVRHIALKAIIDARSKSPEMKNVPGGDTGFVIRRTRVIGLGAAAEHVTDYVIDTRSMDMFLKIERQAAQEMGQWAEKADPSANARIVDNVVIYLPQKDGAREPAPPAKRLTDIIEQE